MDSLYVCLFSNGHVKVGRSATPSVRVSQHADRVKCLGIWLDRVEYWDARNAVMAEAVLIGRCAAHASARHDNEWFVGLSFDQVCEWAAEVANTEFRTNQTPGHLREYLQREPDAMSVSELRKAMNALGADLQDDAQIRQWIAVDAEGNFKRQPGAAYAMCLERATNGRVKRQVMRPNDAHLIWPELAQPS